MAAAETIGGAAAISTIPAVTPGATSVPFSVMNTRIGLASSIQPHSRSISGQRRA